MKEKTAVEYLKEHFQTLINNDEKGLYKLLFEQAKEIEEEQHKKTWTLGMLSHTGDMGEFFDYYNKTYNMKQETNIKLDTLEKLIKECFNKIHNYSQLTINLVQEAEEVFAFKGKGLEDLLKFRDDIDNILEVIDKTKVYDYDALVLLQVLVNEKLTWKGTENKKELTAVEFLEERYNDPILKDNFITKEEFQRAKEIEKKQRIKDLHNGFNTARIYPGILYQDTELSTSFDELK